MFEVHMSQNWFSRN